MAQHQPIVQLYKSLLAESIAAKGNASKKSRLLSAARLVCFAIAAAGVFAFAKTQSTAWLGAAIAFSISFVALAVTHSRLIIRIRHTNDRISVLQNEIDCMALNPTTYDDGGTFKKLLPFADDLDLFGKKSLFHLINRCRTQQGQTALAQGFIETETSHVTIAEKQEAIKELSQKNEFRIESLTRLFGIESDKTVEPKPLEISTFLQTARWAYPVASIAAIVFFAFTMNFIPMLACFFFAWITAYRFSATTSQCSAEAESLYKQLSVFEDIMGNGTQFKSDVLNKIKAIQTESASETKKLGKIQASFEKRENLLWISLSNILFLNDLHLIKQYHDWTIRNSTQTKLWSANIADFEKLLSYACFAANNPEYAYPTFTDSLHIEGKNLRHPLIVKDLAIGNDIQLGPSPRFMLITGSNMSGKSTWLRTVGINAILAQTGMPVCADSLIIRPMTVLSSLRQSDSLAESTSLFMNELNELSHIINKVKADTPCLVLLDEILRGTNSDDKYTGSLAVARKLASSNSITIMATHDLKLGELEESEPEAFTNHCFESKVEDGQLLFDYRIRKGVATNRNATWLMKKMGIV